MTGYIFNIQKFCLHDGPGIRTTVFFKGCNLRCKWCANPESQEKEKQLTLDIRKCTGCGRCVGACPQGARKLKNGVSTVDMLRCNTCGVCRSGCHVGAIHTEGREVTAEEVVTEVMKDKAFYDHSGGGVTFSGGEVLLQWEFAAEEAYTLRQQGVHVAVETAGAVPETVFAAMLKTVDYVLMDLKHYDHDAHLAGTGIGNEQILRNLQLLKNSSLPFLIRIPVIPGFNNDLKDAEKFAELLTALDIREVELLPFHQLGQHKYSLLNMDYAYADCKQLQTEDLAQYREVFTHRNITVKG